MGNKSFYASMVFLILLVGSVNYAIVEIRNYQAQITNLNQQVASLNGEISTLKEQLRESKADNDRLEAQLKNRNEAREESSNVKNVTLAELQRFLSVDPTDKHPYEAGVYVCDNFSHDLQTRAAAHNISIYYARIDYFVEGLVQPRGTHALNGAYLSDGRWVWIDPQLDKIYFGSIEDYLASFFQVPRSVVIWVIVDSRVSYN